MELHLQPGPSTAYWEATVSDTVPKRFRRATLHHGHWCSPTLDGCNASPCLFANRPLVADSETVTVAVVQTGRDRTALQLLGEDGVILSFTNADQVNRLIDAITEAAVIRGGDWPEFEIA